MKTELLKNESIIKQGPASVLRGIENVGGKMYLTNQRLVFESHAINIQNGSLMLDLNDLIAEPSWTRIGSIRLFPNALKVHSSVGEFLFTVYGRKKWAEAVHQLKSQP